MESMILGGLESRSWLNGGWEKGITRGIFVHKTPLHSRIIFGDLKRSPKLITGNPYNWGKRKRGKK